MKGILRILKYISKHPLTRHNKVDAFIRFLKWQLVSKISPGPVIVPFMENKKIILKKSMKGATGNYYSGLHDYEDMSLLLHFLRPDDLFIDVGANVGVYSILCSGVVGARTICFEPDPENYQWLKYNIQINDISNKVELHNVALGDKEGVVLFTKELDTKNKVINDQHSGKNQHNKVKMEKLDIILHNRRPNAMKLDVEGYEYFVLSGASKVLESRDLNIIVIELNGSGKSFSIEDDQIDSLLKSFNYNSYQYDPDNRQLLPVNYNSKRNTVYIKDQESVKKRIASAPKFKVNNQLI